MRVPYYIGDPKGDPNLDKYPYMECVEAPYQNRRWSVRACVSRVPELSLYIWPRKGKAVSSCLILKP